MFSAADPWPRSYLLLTLIWKVISRFRSWGTLRHLIGKTSLSGAHSCASVKEVCEVHEKANAEKLAKSGHLIILGNSRNLGFSHKHFLYCENLVDSMLNLHLPDTLLFISNFMSREKSMWPFSPWVCRPSYLYNVAKENHGLLPPPEKQRSLKKETPIPSLVQQLTRGQDPKVRGQHVSRSTG